MKGKLASIINRIERVVSYHVGNNGDDVHLPASRFNSGFMTPEQLRKMEEGAGDRSQFYQSVSNPKPRVSVLSLPAGKYEGNLFTDLPMPDQETSVWEIDVATSYSGEVDAHRKQIWATHSYYGYLFYRVIHTSGDPNTGTNGWKRIGYETRDSYTATFDDPSIVGECVFTRRNGIVQVKLDLTRPVAFAQGYRKLFTMPQTDIYPPHVQQFILNCKVGSSGTAQPSIMTISSGELGVDIIHPNITKLTAVGLYFSKNEEL